jgi:hypothetical protein
MTISVDRQFPIELCESNVDIGNAMVYTLESGRSDFCIAQRDLYRRCLGSSSFSL